MIQRRWLIVLVSGICVQLAAGQSKEVRDLLEKGDAAKALDVARKAVAADGTSVDALRTGFIAATAAGDAQFADECLKKLAEKVDGDEKSRIARRRQWLVGVGREAPDITIECEGNSPLKVAQRGDKVLLIDFWNVLAAPSKEQVAAIRKLFDGLRENPNVEFVGVNADVDARIEKARGFAKTSKYEWPQCYELPAGKPPITGEAFRAGNSPWTVLIDSCGGIRAVGAADEPAFQYAVKTAIAEARGEFEPVMPRNRDGQQLAKPGSRGELAKAAEKAAADKPAKKPQATGDLPSNPEAKKLLIEAHAMRRTGIKTKAREMYQKIVNEYPGTREAQEAQEHLE